MLLHGCRTDDGIYLYSILSTRYTTITAVLQLLGPVRDHYAEPVEIRLEQPRRDCVTSYTVLNSMLTQVPRYVYISQCIIWASEMPSFIAVETTVTACT